MDDTLPSQVEIKPRLPIEVCERVIEAVYDDKYDSVPAALATLARCALVCRAWRLRAQRVLFEFVLLRDKNGLYRFAELLDASPELGTYVRTLELRGHLHVPYSPAVLFLTLLRGKLPNLLNLYIRGFTDGEKAAEPLPEGVKELPCLPIHPYLPSLLTSISHIRTLRIADVKFPSFGDFARLLSMLPNLKWLSCVRVSWAGLGREPVCMAKHSSYSCRKPFLPILERLNCIDMDEQGRQSLLSALGPSLSRLWIKLPNDTPASGRVEHPDVEQEAPSLSLNLRSFPCLDCLLYYLAPFPQPHDQTLETLQDTLVSWVSGGGDEQGEELPSKRYLYLGAWRRDQFKREEYVELLRTIGPIVEAALCRWEPAEGDLGYQSGAEASDHREPDPCRASLFVAGLGDRLEWEEWWSVAIAQCFPILSRWKRVYVYAIRTGEYSFSSIARLHWEMRN
ncbi:hypothetical protein C8T65DRAFT_173848 [Cerioporus squamosus]|nr:hypothetical protein C8T65DRAFT_173848 [Cerioporus squamosus]